MKNKALATVILLLFFLTTSYAANENPECPDEYLIKAAFIIRFIDFIEWPMKESNPDLNMVIIGKDPFGIFLDNYIENTIAKRNKTLRVQRISPDDNIPDYCQLAFINEKDPKKLSKIINRLKEKPILTIGEEKLFNLNEGIISFIKIKEKVNFVINIRAAKKAKLKINPALLKLAYKIIK